ncbi:MAG: M14 family zinc carboxypeptidase [Bacteroidota bacterium]|nr:M14 family zinc carboxypeptidase [Bacteroidota bacterium]
MKKQLTLLLTLFISFCLMGQTPQYSRVKIFADEQEMHELMISGIPLDDAFIKKASFAIAELSAGDLEILKEKDISFEVLIEDVQAFYQARYEQSDFSLNREANDTYPIPDGWELGTMGGMYTLSQVQAELDSMHSLYPDLITAVQQIGNHESIEGRPIQWVKISDNPDQNEEEPEVLYTALHHAREGIGVQQMIYYMYYLLENYDTDEEIKSMVDNTELYFIPVINPDGYFYNEDNYPGGSGMWRKNRRDNGDGYWGVDLNRNYAYEWGHDNSGSSPYTSDETYRGAAPFSEPEIQAVSDFCNEHEFVIALNYHSYSNLLLSPWGYTEDPCPDNEVFLAYAGIMTRDNGYTYGPGSTTIYPTNGGSDDWMYGEQDEKPLILSYTPEVGSSNDGFWPPYNRIVPLCQENMYQNIMAARLSGKYASIKDMAPFTFSDPEGYLQYELKRLGQTNATFTVSIEPLNDAVTSTGDPKLYEDMDVLESIQDSISFVLNSNLQPGDEIIYLLKVDNGEITDADTVTKYFGIPQVIFEDDGNALTNWTGEWAVTGNNYHSPTGSITDSPFGNYSNYENSVITLSEEIDLADAAVAFLSFYAMWEIESGWDYVQVEASKNGGSVWEPLAGKFTRNGNENQAAGEPLYDGFQTGWVKEEIMLEGYSEESIKIRFRLVSDSWVNEDGFYFDDLRVSVISTVTGTQYKARSEVLLSAPRPNPSNGMITFRYETDTHDIPQNDLMIYNAEGIQVFTEPLENSRQEIQIDVADWKPGIYFFRLSGHPENAGKFIVQ